jgi:hypothetical protein
MEKSFTTEWICTKCNTVFGSLNPTCCGKEYIEEFSLEKHGERLIGLSNSWISIWEHWKDDPLFAKACSNVYETGNYGASMCMNEFITILRGCRCKEPLPETEKDETEFCSKCHELRHHE